MSWADHFGTWIEPIDDDSGWGDLRGIHVHLALPQGHATLGLSVFDNTFGNYITKLNPDTAVNDPNRWVCVGDTDEPADGAIAMICGEG